MFKTIGVIGIIIGGALTVMYFVYGLTSDNPMPWVSGWMAGPIILLTTLPMFSIGRLADGAMRELRGHTARGFEGAPIAMGTIVSAQRTGLSINDQPQLEILFDVDTMDGQSFRGVAKAIIDLTELASVVPGAILPVRYRPGSTDGKIAIAADAPQHELQAVLDRVRVAKGLVSPRQLQIAEQGVEAKAVVLAMAPTGDLQGDRAVMDIKFRVTRADTTTFDLDQRKPIDAGALAQLQPGMVVRVRYLPHDESELVVLTTLNP
ncbi:MULTISPECIES: hypothetical protein [Glycomyces]|uniref:Uncharacterized protein n=2 Tax=Glycomyces TaxID=58113 RepID=A0A9X3PKS4_9ACTN|nr:hypothetical protein [Glycomyces lechevalierae]MDA1385699.1 hypothetical protein [Glycomyces lechevalierae]MDR7339818.1 hypothetical protein [Glycomyces lechevalierae]